jgi:hypothetical protein
MNVVALGGVPGIGVIAVTHGLGAYGSAPPPPANPLLSLGGGEDETFDEYLGFFKSVNQDVHERGSGASWGFGPGVVADLDDEEFGGPLGAEGRPSDVAERLLARARKAEFFAASRRPPRSGGGAVPGRSASTRKTAEVTITIRGVKYTVRRDLPS